MRKANAALAAFFVLIVLTASTRVADSKVSGSDAELIATHRIDFETIESGV